MKKLQHQKCRQLDLFSVSETLRPMSQFVCAYRISMVRDDRVRFSSKPLDNPNDAQRCLQDLIRNTGQPDREQFCILMLNAKNFIIGTNIVSIGGLSSAPVHPREVLKPAILANSAALILGHNHPSGDITPSIADHEMTKIIIQAANVIGITIHEHLIISMDDEKYFSFAQEGLIRDAYETVKNQNIA